MKQILKFLIIILVISGCSTHNKNLVQFDKLFWPDMVNPKIALVDIINMQKIRENYSFFRKFFGLEHEIQPLYRPFAVAANDEYVAVSDIMFGVIYLINKNNFKLRIIKSINNKRFKSIVDLDFADNDLYMVDSENNIIIKYNVIDEASKVIDVQLEKPVSIKVDIKNHLIFLADTKRNKIIVTDLGGNIIKEFDKYFNFPLDVDIIPEEKILFVLDSMNFRVLKLDYDGNLIGEFGEIGNRPGNFSKPKGLCIDEFHRIYITDADFDNFQIFDEKGNLLYFIGQNGSDEVSFYMPARVYCYKDEIYVSDLFNSRVKVFKSFR
ncbi:hypothetical protein OWM07_10855 [Deferribacter thermophilus]|uniref:hypothetical protein n=1 Tax=Deferribacter thermophilus TaxID=53573 RepID=UPI003C1604AB